MAPADRPTLPPRWIIRTIWRGHRALSRMDDGRWSLRPPADGRAGILRLRTRGRRTGEERAALLCYVRHGDDLVTLAMNGWGAADPAWWLNLGAHPDARVDTADGSLDVRGRAATGDERAALWDLCGAHRGWGDGLDRLAALRERETAVVVLEPRG